MNAETKNLASASLALAFGILCIAFSAIFVKFAALPGTTSAFYRVLFAAVVAIPLWLLKRKPFPDQNSTLLTLAGGSFFAIELVLWQVAVLVTSAANATLLVNLAPAWVAQGAMFLFREKLSSYFWRGLLIAFIGMALVASGGTHQLAGMNRGDLLAVAGSFFYALYLLVTQRVRAWTRSPSWHFPPQRAWSCSQSPAWHPAPRWSGSAQRRGYPWLRWACSRTCAATLPSIMRSGT